METYETEWHTSGGFTPERPSADFLKAVADLLETDAEDLLVEMGYLSDEAVVAEAEAVPA